MLIPAGGVPVVDLCKESALRPTREPASSLTRPSASRCVLQSVCLQRPADPTHPTWISVSVTGSGPTGQYLGLDRNRILHVSAQRVQFAPTQDLATRACATHRERVSPSRCLQYRPEPDRLG